MTRIGAGKGSPAWHAATGLGAWEGMVARLTAGWHPDGWYPAAYYREDLETRDSLVGAADVLPAHCRAEFTTALDTIDRRFLDATVDDGGEALAAATGTVPDRWWWRRITHPLPWHGMPDGS